MFRGQALSTATTALLAALPMALAACSSSRSMAPPSFTPDVNSQVFRSEPGFARQVSSASNKLEPSVTETTLWSFACPPDGWDPYAGLTNVGGILYGTTNRGGTNNYGIVFKITTSGTERVLYSFAGGSDGSDPYAGLTNVNGTLYGTTYDGGTNGDGAVFKITKSGKETVLHSFAGGSDGAHPYAGLTNVGGTLFGTTNRGGTSGDGTVFKITTSGVESVLHNFASGTDGSEPYAGLINVRGALYGTTQFGGTSGNVGTVFKITTSGTEHVLHDFGADSDGSEPYGGLINVNGTLYGTTYSGGVSGDGTVFKITKSGKETVLYSFAGGLDGAQPYAGLTSMNGMLYGTTYQGGVSGQIGYGTVFKITTSGVESVLYRFQVNGDPSDGAYPAAGLSDVGGTLYGTTTEYGQASCGTVFSLTT